MVFSSITFLFIFLPIVYISYLILPSIRFKNALLILASLFFYAWGEPVYVLLMIFSALFNYIFGLLLTKYISSRLIVILAIIFNIGILAVFKYSNFIVDSINVVLGLHITIDTIQLPIGISFFTFQALSYVIDVFRDRSQVQKNYWRLLLYISFFPQLIAGPIIKYHDIASQIEHRKFDVHKVALGIRRFIFGMSKKVLIANTMATTADSIFALSNDLVNLPIAWLGALCYVLQIYYDFSGYSDMAIGLGKMFGFDFKENFNYPYIATSVQDFWRRWHISLSSWFREYLYFPLGGNRKGKVRTNINRIIVFFFTGLWHGANWTFVVWGIYHGTFLLLENINTKIAEHKIKFFRHIYLLLVVTIGFVIFRSDTLSQAIHIIEQMFIGWDLTALSMSIFLQYLDPLFITTFILGCIFVMPVKSIIEKRITNSISAFENLSFILSLLLLFLCMMSLASNAYNPFIYFRF